MDFSNIGQSSFKIYEVIYFLVEVVSVHRRLGVTCYAYDGGSMFFWSNRQRGFVSISKTSFCNPVCKVERQSSCDKRHIVR